MKLRRFSKLIFVAALFGILAVLFIKADTAQATFSDMYILHLMYRMESEVLQKTPAGQYYDVLFWGHSYELGQLVAENPGKYEELMDVTRLFVPGFEALLNGTGDTVFITSEQVQKLEAELDWFSLRGSSALKADIEKEKKRLQLDNMIGMTFSDAWQFINAIWIPVGPSQFTATPTAVPQLLPTANVVGPIQILGTDGKWSYYMINGVYLEYPTDYYISPQNLSFPSISFMPAEAFPTHLDRLYIWVDIGNIPVAEKNKLAPHFWYAAEEILWEKTVQNGGFDGVEFIVRTQDDPMMQLNAILYHEESQTAVHVSVKQIPFVPAGSDYSEFINQKIPYFQHLVDRIRMQTP
jgi:hypothetical protein